MTIKQQIREALKNGDNKLVLRLLGKLSEPKPKKPTKQDKPYYLPFVYKKQ